MIRGQGHTNDETMTDTIFRFAPAKPSGICSAFPGPWASTTRSAWETRREAGAGSWVMAPVWGGTGARCWGRGGSGEDGHSPQSRRWSIRVWVLSGWKMRSMRPRAGRRGWRKRPQGMWGVWKGISSRQQSCFCLCQAPPPR